MFEQVGRKLQTISTVIFSIQAIAIVVGGLMLWGVFDFRIEFLFIVAIIIGIGIVYAWLGQLLLQALGKITESCELQISAGEAVSSRSMENCVVEGEEEKF